MAKGIYVGVAGKARKVKKAYVGIADKARKIKKSIHGDRRRGAPLLDGRRGRLLYGTVTPLSKGRGELAGASVGSYILFAGGSGSNTVDAYVAA